DTQSSPSTACWTPKIKGIAARGASLHLPTRPSVSAPTDPVTAAVAKLAVAEKHMVRIPFRHQNARRPGANIDRGHPSSHPPGDLAAPMADLAEKRPHRRPLAIGVP